MPARTITLPNDWRPRDYQLPLWKFLEGGGKRAVAVWHRRSGKDALCMNRTACAALERVGLYWHLLPELAQGRRVIWNAIDAQGRRMVEQAFPMELRDQTIENEMRIRLRNGSIWQVVGSDNYDSLVGGAPVGVIFSEFSIADPRAWDYVRPILAENDGWAVFISTPRGQNHFAELYEVAKPRADWFSQILTVDDTGAISPAAITAEREAGMPESLIRQEFYCSFQAGVAGAYYGEYIETAEAEGRIGNVPWEPTVPVMTAWDLGVADATSIWCAQRVGKELRLIDYVENSGVGLEFYARELDRKPYIYGEHLLPPDARVRELGSGRSRVQILKSLGVNGSIVPRLGIEDGIAAVRTILGSCWFDAQKCARGIKALRNYRTEFDDKLGTFRARPVHDQHSHGADAFRYLAVGLRGAERRRRSDPASWPAHAESAYDAFG